MTSALIQPATDNADLSSNRNEYSELRRRLIAKGLFARQPRFYVPTVLMLLGLYVTGFAVMVLASSVWVRLLDAAFLGFVFTQIGFLGHDAGHRQVFASRLRNDVLGLGVGLMLGTSRSWWVVNHNAHHSFPNDLARDPHTALPAMAFSVEQAKSKRGVMGFITRFQAFYFFPMLLLEGFGIRLASIQFLFSGRARYPFIEAVSILAHFTIYFALLSTLMNGWQVTGVVLIHQGLMGFYMGSVFAPNHKGMLVVGPDTQLDFLRQQVLTTRNVKPHLVTDFLYGGLNYQIEHHLFPNLPRNRLKAARPIVKTFCAERGIDYYETGVFRSYWEVARYLYEVSEPARFPKRAGLAES